LKDRFKEYSDEQLIELLRDGEVEIEDYLMVKYKNLVRKKANSMYILGGDTEDLIQEGMIGLLKAVRDYDFGRDASFYTFAELCVSRQMYTAVQASNRKKHAPLNNSISLNEEYKQEEGNEQSENYSLYKQLSDYLSDKGSENNPESMLISQEYIEQVEDIAQTHLSDFEKQVFELHLTGMNYAQVAKVLGRDEKSTDNAIQRAKRKLKEELAKVKKSL